MPRMVAVQWRLLAEIRVRSFGWGPLLDVGVPTGSRVEELPGPGFPPSGRIFA